MDHMPGLREDSTYITWSHMKQRCINRRDPSYVRYGGRGITVCERWLSFENFITDMGWKPEGLTLERLDNMGNYELSNCKWATIIDQANNRRSNTNLTLNDVTKTIAQWASYLDINPQTISTRLRRGWSVERALAK